MTLLEPKEITLKRADGSEKTFVISKFPAVAGREIVTKYPVANIPKIGTYQQSEEVMLKLMCFVGVPIDGGQVVPLSTRALVDNHTGDWKTLARLEWATLEYNCNFFENGLNSGSLESISQKAVVWISQTLMPLLAQSLEAAKQPSGNSKPN